MKTVTDLKADLKKCSQDDNIFISKSTERKYMKPAANLEGKISKFLKEKPQPPTKTKTMIIF